MRIRYENGYLIEEYTIIGAGYPKKNDILVREYYGKHNNLIKQKQFTIDSEGTLKEIK